MQRILPAMAVAGLFLFVADLQAAAQEATPTAATRNTGATITLPAQTKINLAMTSPVWAKSAAPGDAIYAQTVFPVALDGTMAIPPGTYVEGRIDGLKRPSLFSGRAEFQVHATKLIFANGYTVLFAEPTASAPGRAAPIADADLQLEVSPQSDVLLDNGTQFEMTLQTALPLDAKSIARAVRVAKPLTAARVPSATLCRPTPGTPGSPGTPDTVIPGSSGTPDTVIPGVNGMPPTVIPGIPATPDTVIPGTPGSPGTPGTSCPGPPIVLSSSGAHSGNFKLGTTALIAGKMLPKGSYRARWSGFGPQVQADIFRGDTEVLTAPARVTVLSGQRVKDAVKMRKNSGGMPEIETLQFSKENAALSFESSPAGNTQ